MSAQKTITLPLWLKFFASEKSHDKKFVRSTDELSHDDSRTIERIVSALKDNKSVIVLLDGQPVEISRDDKGEIQIEPLAKVNYAP